MRKEIKEIKKGTGIDHMTERKRRQNLAKCCSSMQRFIAKLNESMKLLKSERSGTSYGEKIF